MAVTIHDIARRLGVAPSTVSRALTGKGRISPATRDRILRVARELGYQPNMNARGLATNCTGTVGVVIHERHRPVERSFYGVILEVIEAEMNQRGYHVIFSCLRDGNLPRCVRERRVDGLVFLGTDFSEELVRPVRGQVPVVLVDNHIPGVDSVVGDNVGGARMATAHLLDHGHRRVAFVVETLADPSFRARFEGYCQVLDEQREGVDERVVVEGGRRRDCDRIAMRKFLTRNPLPTAVVAANDYIAVGAVVALAKAGIKVPQEVAVVGFDDGDLATVVQPPLTTVHVPRASMGEVAANRLLKLLQDQTVPPVLTVLPTTLTVRESCGCRGPTSSR